MLNRLRKNVRKPQAAGGGGFLTLTALYFRRSRSACAKLIKESSLVIFTCSELTSRAFPAMMSNSYVANTILHVPSFNQLPLILTFLIDLLV